MPVKVLTIKDIYLSIHPSNSDQVRLTFWANHGSPKRSSSTQLQKDVNCLPS